MTPESPATPARADLPHLPEPPPPATPGHAPVEHRRGQGKHRAPDRAAIRRYHAGAASGESLGTVAIAIGADLAMFAAKAIAAVLTGSAALFAETLHSLADTGNQLLLLKGLRRARQRPDRRHPFGYGAELFYWSLLAALGIFTAGGVLSVWEGTQRLLHPSAVQAGLLGFAVLGLGCLLDGTSWLTSVRQLRREAAARGVPLRQHIRTTTDTAVTAVYYEDSAALTGNAIALAGLSLHQLLVPRRPTLPPGSRSACCWLPSGCGWRRGTVTCSPTARNPPPSWTASATCSPPTRTWSRSARSQASTWGRTSSWSPPRSSHATRSQACACASSSPTFAGA